MTRTSTSGTAARRKTATRYDALVENDTGRGTSRDKVRRIQPGGHSMTEVEARQWYLANGFIQNIVDAPAEDATREWITIRTNRDTDEPDTGARGLGIARLIENRMTELGVREKLKELVRFSRMYNRGGFLFYGVIANTPQTDRELSREIPGQIKRLDYLNVISPEYVPIVEVNFDPLSRLYHHPQFQIMGSEVHRSRLSWMVHSYVPEERRGVSVIETILDAVLAQDTSLWSVIHLVFEMSVKVFKSPRVQDLDPEKLAEFLAKMRAVMSTMSMVAIDKDEDLGRVTDAEANSNLKQIFDFIFENLAGLARMPKSRLMGQSQGVITAGQYDLLNYYDNIAKFQELELRPIIEKIIGLIVRESDGAIHRALGGRVDGLDWEFDFNPLWRIAPGEEADIELKQAQTDQIYITSAVLDPTEVRARRFKELEEFSSWGTPAAGFRSPKIASPKSPGGESEKHAAGENASPEPGGEKRAKIGA